MQLQTCPNHIFINEIEIKERSWLTFHPMIEWVFSEMGDETFLSLLLNLNQGKLGGPTNSK